MPKMKTHSGAKKRFGVTRTGKVIGRAAHKRHRMTSKSKRGKMEGRSTNILNESDARIILDNFLPYERAKRRKGRQFLKKQQQRNAKAAAKKEAA